MIRLALRFDDPSATSDRALEVSILDAARNAGISMTLAVIPFRQQASERIQLTAERASHLVQAHREGVIEVAQHGFCHEPEFAGQTPPSEFRGVDFGRQLERIHNGRSALEGVFGPTISGFVPPWNTFDPITTRALAQCGFRYLSAGEEIYADCAPGLAYLPCTCQMTGLQQTLDEVAPYASLDPVVVAVMHHYDFHESGSPQAKLDLDGFSTLLQTLRRDTRLQISTVSGLIDSHGAMLASRLQQRAWGRLHWRIRKRLPTQAMFRQIWPRLLVQTLYST